MANQVKIDLSLQDMSGSVKKRTNEVRELNKELKTSQQMATGTRTGSGAVRASFSTASETVAYGQARGSMGATGAGARDFANQAQGLGGLVRLYATYAANIFALSAAFNALREAMATDIMIQGLNQLGAASGVAMGALAKNFAQASGGAISLRESMEATAKAVSSGLTTAQFMELGKVAKGASQALGVNMSDAVSRLTRGITKLEPELLDELGIFTKVGKAAEDYARSVGKSVSSLTDFERRQAFANAVLAEGVQKFGEISVQTNPYDELLASLKNTAQSILSTVNTVVAPIAKLLADNVGLIGAAFALMGIKIVQQALPALLSWQKGLAAAAADSAEKLGELVSPEGFVERAQARFNIPKLQADLARAEAVYAKSAQQFANVDNNYKNKGSPLLKTIASGATLEGNNYANAVKQITKSTENLDAAQVRHINSLKVTVAASDAVVAARKRLADANELVQASADRPLSLREKAQESAYREAAGTRDRLTILAGVGAVYDREGFAASIRNANEAAKNSSSLSKFGQVVTTVQATAVAGAKALSLFGGRLLNLIPIVGTAYAAYEILSAIFSVNSKEVSKFRDGLDQLKEITKTNIDVFKKYGEVLTPQSLSAKAAAFGDLAAQISRSTSELQAADESAGWFDRQIDAILSLIGKDLKSGFTKQMAVALSEGIKNIPDKGIRDELSKKLMLETGAKNTSISALADALDEISTEDIVAKGRAIGDLIAAANKPLQTSMALSKDIQDSLKATADAELTLRNSLRKTDNVASYYEKLVDQVSKLSKGFKDATAAGAQFQAIAQGSVSLDFLGADAATKLQSIASEYNRFASSIARGSTTLQDTRQKLADIEQKLSSRLLKTDVRSALNKEANELRRFIEAQSSQIDNLRSKLPGLAASAQSLFQEAFTKSFDNAIESAARKSKLISLQGARDVLASSPTQTPESIKQQIELDKQMVRLKLLEITSQYDLIDALDRNAAERNISDLKTRIEGLGVNEIFAPERKRLEADLAVQQATLNLLNRTQTSQDMATLRASGGSGIAQIQRFSARNEATASARNELRMIDIRGQQQILDVQYKNLTDLLNTQKTTLEQELTSLKESPSFIGLSASDQLRQSEALEARLVAVTNVLATLPAALNLAKTQVSGNTGQVAAATQSLLSAQTISTGATGISVTQRGKAESAAGEVENLTLATSLYKEYFTIRKDDLDVSKNDLEYKQQTLQLDLNRGKISQDQFNAKKFLLDMEQAALERNNAILAEDEKLTSKIIDLRTRAAQAGGETPEISQAIKDANTERNNAVNAINRQYGATKGLLELTKEQMVRQVAYEDIFKNSFNNMADALTNFALTGKFEFKEMINSMIADIIRFELRQQAMASWQAVRAPIMSFFGLNAMGNVYDHGLQKFGKGGAFTNKIVDSPTVFKFAKGTGLMGEAGPEAIMPLKRDNMGNLGVRASGLGTGSDSNVEVVVNNYSNMPASAQETVDARGNRRVEVTIGDMTAGEISRSGSAAQKSVVSTFGIKPQLIRR